MKILIVGQEGTYPAVGYSTIMHGSHVRPLAIARALANCGHDVTLLHQKGAAAVKPATSDQINTPGFISSFDAVILSGITGLRHLRKLPAYEEARRHPSVALVVDTVHGDADAPSELSWIRLIAASSSLVTAEYMRQRGGRGAVYAPWCCPTDVELTTSPWPDDRQRVIFVGAADARHVDVLNYMAENLPCELWVAGIFRDSEFAGGMTEEQRKRALHPKLKLATDLFGVTFAGAGHGPVRYTDGCRMMQHATVGLNLTPAVRDLIGVSCKLYDYIAMGLPVVSEPSRASDGDLAAVDGNRMVPWNDPPALLAATIDLLKGADVTRADMRAHALARFSWESMVKVIVGSLQGPL